MVSVYGIKPRFQSLLRPCTRLLAHLGVTANAITVAAALLSVASGAATYVYADQPRVLLLLPAVLFLRMALNAIDGMLAREHRMQSRLGAILNELGDVISDTALYLPLALVTGFAPQLVVALVVLAIVAEFTGVACTLIGAGRRYDGPMGKSDRALVLGAVGLLLGLGVAPGAWLQWILWGTIALLVVTVWNRARKGLREPS